MLQEKQEQYKEIGKTLKDCRESINLSAREVADALRIRSKYVNAIEAGDLSVLPSEVYVRGYIRNYAALLGLNAQEMLGQFDRPAITPAHSAAYYYPVPARQQDAPGGHILILSLLCVVLTFVYWYGFERADPARIEKVEKLPPKFEAMLYGDPEKINETLDQLAQCFEERDGNTYPFCMNASIGSVSLPKLFSL